MANVNTTLEFVNLPAQAIGTAVETTLLVPASGYATLPSPTLTANSGLYLGIPADIVGSVFDGHAFKVRLVGKVTTSGAYTFLPKLYQVPGAVALAGTSATVANDNVTVALAATSIPTTTQNFLIETEYLWDSTSKKLNGFVIAARIDGTNIAPNAGTAGTLVSSTSVTGVGLTDLNFIPSFTFGTAAAGNSVQLTEFSIDRA